MQSYQILFFTVPPIGFEAALIAVASVFLNVRLNHSPMSTIVITLHFPLFTYSSSISNCIGSPFSIPLPAEGIFLTELDI